MFRLRRKPPNLTPVRADVDQLTADIIALHRLAFHPGRACEEDIDGRCTAISRRSTRWAP